MRSGFSSALISSPTFSAAASVNTTLGGGGADVPVVPVDSMFDFPGIRPRLCFAGESCGLVYATGLFQQWYRPFGLVDKLAIDFGTNRHFD